MNIEIPNVGYLDCLNIQLSSQGWEHSESGTEKRRAHDFGAVDYVI